LGWECSASKLVHVKDNPATGFAFRLRLAAGLDGCRMATALCIRGLFIEENGTVGWNLGFFLAANREDSFCRFDSLS
jgi:hypothetical protein